VAESGQHPWQARARPHRDDVGDLEQLIERCFRGCVIARLDNLLQGEVSQRSVAVTAPRQLLRLRALRDEHPTPRLVVAERHDRDWRVSCAHATLAGSPKCAESPTQQDAGPKMNKYYRNDGE